MSRPDTASDLLARRVFAPRASRRLTDIVPGDARLSRSVTIIGATVTGVIWLVQPLADTEFLGLAASRFQTDTTGYTQFRLVANILTAALAGATLRLKYWTGSAWANAEVAATTADTVIDTAGVTAGAWATITPSARGDVQFAIFGQGGNGIIGPVFFGLHAQFR